MTTLHSLETNSLDKFLLTNLLVLLRRSYEQVSHAVDETAVLTDAARIFQCLVCYAQKMLHGRAMLGSVVSPQAP